MVETPLDVLVGSLRIAALGPVKIVPIAAKGTEGTDVDRGAWPIPPGPRIPPAAVIIAEWPVAVVIARPHIAPLVRKAGRLEIGRRVDCGKRSAGWKRSRRCRRT